MVANDMTVFSHLSDEIGAGFPKVSDDEKGGWSVVLFSRFEDGRRIAVFKSTVESKVEDLVFRIPNVIGPGSGKLFGGGICLRRRSFLGKT